MAKPRYRHDCDVCLHLGNIDYPAPMSDGSTKPKHAELYYCHERGGGPTLSDYSSLPASMVKTLSAQGTMSTTSPALVTAHLFARAKGLLKP